LLSLEVSEKLPFSGVTTYAQNKLGNLGGGLPGFRLAIDKQGDDVAIKDMNEYLKVIFVSNQW
jgi:hypothetical protein